MPGPNHPWNMKGRIFTCEPDCPKRKPGCQDHCKTYLDAKVVNDKRLADEFAKRKAEGYACDSILKSKDIVARRKRRGLD